MSLFAFPSTSFLRRKDAVAQSSYSSAVRHDAATAALLFDVSLMPLSFAYFLMTLEYFVQSLVAASRTLSVSVRKSL